ncbi:hypothetical protein CVE28_16510, partial [Pseudomonas syringae pv. actinidiae]|nr:hypothetical protein [Pseudomonas syringae pv. actinidiae]
MLGQMSFCQLGINLFFILDRFYLFLRRYTSHVIVAARQLIRFQQLFANLPLNLLVYRLKINFSHACVVIAARTRCILFKISSPLV